MHMKSYMLAKEALLLRYGSSLNEGDFLVDAMVRIDERFTAAQE